MKTIRALYERLNVARKLQDRYPMFNLEDRKIHVLFLSSFLNESGYYRMILPALELNQTDSHCAIVANLHKWDFHKFVDDYDHPIYFPLVKWAHYIVLPAMFTDAAYIIQCIRKINRKADIIMDIDLNYHQLPDYHPESKTLSREVRSVLVKNLALVDILTAPNNAILNTYNQLVVESEKQLKYTMQYPNLTSRFSFEEVNPIFKNSGEKIRIGLLLDGSLPEDLATIEKVLIELMQENQNKIDLVIYGWRHKVTLNANLLVGLKVQYVPIANTMDFPMILNKMVIDIGLIPFVDNNYNRSGRVFNRFLDFSAMCIPSVMPAAPPFLKRITDGETCFLASTPEEWKAKITRLINEPQLRTDIGQAAQRELWERYSYTNVKAVQRLTEVFA